MKIFFTTWLILVAIFVNAQTSVTPICLQIKSIDESESVARKESEERQKRRKMLQIDAIKERNRRKWAVQEETETKIFALRKEMVKAQQNIDEEYCEF
jgi:predicted Holliday junction resolvase-like endonuclease